MASPIRDHEQCESDYDDCQCGGVSECDQCCFVGNDDNGARGQPRNFEVESDPDLDDLDPYEQVVRPTLHRGRASATACKRSRPQPCGRECDASDSRTRSVRQKLDSRTDAIMDDVSPTATVPSAAAADIDTESRLIDDLIASALEQQAQQAARLVDLTRRRTALQQAAARPASQMCSRGTRYCHSKHSLEWTNKLDDLEKFDDVVSLLFKAHPRCGIVPLDPSLRDCHTDEGSLNGTPGMRPSALFDAYRGGFEDSAGSRSTRQWWCMHERASAAQRCRACLFPAERRLTRNTFYKCCNIRLCTLRSQNQPLYLGLRKHRLHHKA